MDNLDILMPAQRLASLNFMFTEKCNLKCIYCPKFSNNTYPVDISSELLQVIIKYIVDNKIPVAGVGFYGETFCFHGWEHPVQILIEAGVHMSLCSNWNFKLTVEQAEILSKFQLLQFSIDTTNNDLLGVVRPKADARTIIFNLHQIRAQSIINARPLPEIMWCSVLSHRILPYLSEFVATAVSNGIYKISFNEIEYYDDASHELMSIFDLHGNDFVAAANAIEGMEQLARQHGVEIVYAFNSFLDLVKAKKNAVSSCCEDKKDYDDLDICRVPIQGIQGNSRHLVSRTTLLNPHRKTGLTRLCIAPWSTAYILADGTVCTCCVRGQSMGNVLSSGSINTILCSDNYREFRWRLLIGNIVDNACLACPVAPITDIKTLQREVANLLSEAE